MLYVYTFHSHYNTEWIANTGIGLDTNNCVIKRLRCTSYFQVLLSHVKYPVIPKRVTIGKRLAQCLHPALPGGVHLKALETYDIIFKCIGTQRLAQDLFIYSAGLFPLLSHAAMNVKPVLLMIYEKHFVSLGKRIKPGLNGLLLGLLPGLEEGSEFYDQ